ncbi:hypothetical protein M2480_002586 [Parabacteroides sp. PFB2-12]|uniref:DUF6807 domain-containing protein n=1 Tax=unclassified Parabacteroides TaxID=2649774 RepID=UPI002472F9CE|nr:MULTISPECIES: PmoA family protein [unclassified Parabacteroides]MDH6341873.1 hypothetical protein [Parabacteroides sp. PM6-13]MDH6391588.1 hypothetical protein [Parabacteroides sp. PFB2-12]
MKHITKVLLIALCVGTCLPGSWAKPLKKMRVTVNAAGVERNNTIASLDLSGYEVPAGKEIVVVNAADKSVCLSQLEQCDIDGTTLYWRIDGALAANETREYIIETQNAQAEKNLVMNITRDRMRNLILTQNGQKVLQYNVAMARLPHGADPVFSRNGYIHPAWSPAGNVLTNINAADHMHHYGIWNPWTMVEYDGTIYDLWNIGDKKGTVLFDSLYTTRTGDLFADIVVGHQHLIFQPQKEQVVNTIESIVKITPKKRINIMDEFIDMRVWNSGQPGYLWDFVSDLIPATELPVLLKAYRYAGFGWRATADWTNENVVMMTSEGKSRPEIDGTNARWIYVTGMSPKGPSGILFMGYPENQNFPEPLRIWDQNANGGRGDAFINFAPTKNVDWELKAGESYRLRYRMFMFDGSITPEKAEAIWQDFAKPVKVTIK